MVSLHGYAEDWGGQYAYSQHQDENANSQRQEDYYAFSQRQDEEYGDDKYTLIWLWVEPSARLLTARRHRWTGSLCP